MINVENLTYTYEELIDKSTTINDFSKNFSKELDYLSDIIKKTSSNFQTEEASVVYTCLNAVKSKEEDIEKALEIFALSIKEEIAPTYKAIEEETAKEVTDYYGNV